MKIRIAVAVGPSGFWSSVGSSLHTDEQKKASAMGWTNSHNMRLVWVEAEVPLPEETPAIEGVVVP